MVSYRLMFPLIKISPFSAEYIYIYIYVIYQRIDSLNTSYNEVSTSKLCSLIFFTPNLQTLTMLKLSFLILITYFSVL